MLLVLMMLMLVLLVVLSYILSYNIKKRQDDSHRNKLCDCSLPLCRAQ
jgi:hypothetical protein